MYSVAFNHPRKTLKLFLPTVHKNDSSNVHVKVIHLMKFDLLADVYRCV